MISSAFLSALTLVPWTLPEPASSEELHEHLAADVALREGRWAKAQERFSRALDEAPDNATLLYGRACAHAGANQIGPALKDLEEAFERGYLDAAVARWDEDLALLREEASFVDLLDRMEQQAADLQPGLRWLVELTGVERRPRAWSRYSSQTGLIAAPNGMRVGLLDVATGAPVRTLEQHQGEVCTVEFSPDGQRLFSLSVDGALFAWSSTDGQLVARVDDAFQASQRTAGWVTCVAGGARVFTYFAGVHKLWTPDLEPVIPLDPQVGTLFQTAPESSRIVFGGQSGWSLVDAMNGKALTLEADLPQEPVTGIGLSADGSLLALGLKGARVRLVELEAGASGPGSVRASFRWQQVATDAWTGLPEDIFGDLLSVNQLTFSPDGRWLAICTASGFFVHVYDVETGELHWRTDHLGGRMGAAMPLVASSECLYGDDGVHRWHLESGGFLEPLNNPQWMGRVQVQGDLVLMSAWGRFAVADQARGLELYEQVLHPDGRQLTVAPSGHYCGDIELVPEAQLGWGNRQNRQRVPLPPDWFDPKRVRAAQAGVPVLSATFE